MIFRPLYLWRTFEDKNILLKAARSKHPLDLSLVGVKLATALSYIYICNKENTHFLYIIYVHGKWKVWTLNPESSRVLDVSIVIFFIEKSDIETLFILFSSMNDALCWKKKSVHIFNAFGLVGKKKRKEERRRVLSIFSRKKNVV